MSFLSLFSKEENSVLGVDIGSSAIKVVQIRKKNGQAVLETYGELALGPYGNATIGQATVLPQEKVAEALVNLMNEKEVSVTTAMCGISIPFGSSLMSVIEMPAVSPKQLAVMVPIEARKYIPVPITEVMLDWSVIPKSDTRPSLEEEEARKVGVPNIPKVDILVVAIHNETIARYKDIVERSHLDAGFFEIEIFSSMRAILDESIKPVLIMDMGAASTKLYIVERGIVKTSHTINRGAQDITQTISKSLGISVQDAEVMKRRVGASGEDKTLLEIINLILEYIFSEANRIILSFEKKYNKPISKAILVGGGAALKGLAPIAQNSLKIETFAGNPFSKLSAPAFIEEVLRDTGPEFAVAVGLALRRLSEEE
ncbi:type IV pilus assembly protein PilM [Candidatus Parcubacteria bacterium]|nr:type IV pilus assembly protein PilM [Candidatus Parcubacteria bacterium]